LTFRHVVHELTNYLCVLVFALLEAVETVMVVDLLSISNADMLYVSATRANL
jgi:hypothetical protein